jgi:hypothetical protein
MPNADRLSIGNYITQDNETVFASTTVVSMRIRRPVVTPLSRACFVLDGALPRNSPVIGFLTDQLLARSKVLLLNRPQAAARAAGALSAFMTLWAGLLAALPTVLPGIPVQRCWAHKIRNIQTRHPSPACATTSTNSSLASVTNLPTGARRYAPPMPSSAVSEKSAGAPGRWAPYRTKHQWTASCSPSSPTKTNHRESVPFSS